MISSGQPKALLVESSWWGVLMDRGLIFSNRALAQSLSNYRMHSGRGQDLGARTQLPRTSSSNSLTSRMSTISPSLDMVTPATPLGRNVSRDLITTSS